MTNDEIETMTRRIVSNIADPPRPIDHIAIRLVEILDEREALSRHRSLNIRTTEPRVWRGERAIGVNGVYFWNAFECAKYTLTGDGTDIDDGDIFVPGNVPRPTEPPPPVEELETCSEVDW